MIHFVSLGPGDPELITLKALRTLREANYIYTPVPVSRKGRHASKAAEMMLSLGIREEQIQLYDLPMSKDRDGALEAYEIVAREACEKQKAEPNARIAIVAEGDCGFYSSSAYIGEHIEQEGEEQCIVIPGEATREEWDRAWQSGHTIVVMKGSLCEAEIKSAIAQHPDRKWHYFEFVGMPKEYITSSTDEILQREFPYFSIIISKRR